MFFLGQFCLSASRFKLFIPKENAIVIFGLSGVRTPQFSRDGSRGGEEFGEEALLFTKKHLMQREVEVSLDTVDRGAAMVGTLYLNGKVWLSVLVSSLDLSCFSPVLILVVAPSSPLLPRARTELVSGDAQAWARSCVRSRGGS